MRLWKRLLPPVVLFALFALAVGPSSGQPAPEKQDFNQRVKVQDANGNETTHATGWKKDPVAVKQFTNRLERNRKKSDFEKAAPKIMRQQADATNPVFYWHSEKKVLGSVQKSWNQKQVGSCVGFGYGRSTQDVMLNEIAAGQAERYPGTEVAPEVVYGGSRVEVGGGGIDGDGSVGAWAAEWVNKWGVVVRGKYATVDLTTYNEATCRRLGETGIPPDIEAVAKVHPITEVALVTTAEGLWAALGAGKGVPVCSMQGFTTVRDRDGFCSRSGQWAHCMCYRGRFVHPARGKCVIEQNSWGDYLGSTNNRFKYVDTDGSVKEETLPEGCFCVELNVAAAALRDRDTFVLAGLTGWEATPPGPGPNPDPVPPQPMPGPADLVTIDVGGAKFVLDFKTRTARLPAGWTAGVPTPNPDPLPNPGPVDPSPNPTPVPTPVGPYPACVGGNCPPPSGYRVREPGGVFRRLVRR